MKHHMPLVLFTLISWAVSSLPAIAAITLPKLISDGMILQRDTELNIWGWARPGEQVILQFKGTAYRTVASPDGEWSFRLPPMPAGGPHTMRFQGDNVITVRDILFGDVWLCSGQSNMVHMLNIHDVEYADEIAQADNPHIRQFLVPAAADLTGPRPDFPSGTWTAATGESVRQFSVVAYFFAEQLYERYQIPIGLINASVGGTPIEAWMSEPGLANFPEALNAIQQNKDRANTDMEAHSQPATPQPDLGLISQPPWFAAAYLPPPGKWRTINVPGYWEDQGIRDLDGVVWYRREVDIPLSMTNKPARVFLGRIVDADVLYINGEEVGHTGYMYPQRRYRIGPDILNPGKNTFTVRVTNHGGKGGFVPDKPYFIATETDTVDLKGTWHYRVGSVFEPGTEHGAGQSALPQNQPAALFNAMISPATNYVLKGVLWYQGESNAGHPQQYAALQAAWISDWRKHWHNDTLPFLYVQLPGFMDYSYLPIESNWAQLRESQRATLSVPNTGMAVAIDLGEWNDVHPGRKGEIGNRLALLARRMTYQENIVSSGPLYQSHKKDGNRIILSFSDIGSGIITIDGESPKEFAVAGEDGKFIWAKAEIAGDQVIVWNDNVPEPAYVRYAWADNPVNPNLYNREGLPASPFQIEVQQAGTSN